MNAWLQRGLLLPHKWSIGVTLLLLLWPVGATVAESDTMAKIRKFCEQEWPVDYSMQDYCINGQVKGANATIDGWNAASEGSAEQGIYSRCYEEWTKGDLTDWSMVDYCADRQLEAYRKLNP